MKYLESEGDLHHSYLFIEFSAQCHLNSVRVGHHLIQTQHIEPHPHFGSDHPAFIISHGSLANAKTKLP